LEPWEARLVTHTRRLIYYFRIIFVLTFVTTQYFFVIIYIAADVLATVASSLDIFPSIIGLSAGGLENKELRTKLEKRRRITVYSIMQIVETIVLVVVLVVPKWLDDSYFSWVRKIEILDVVITNMHVIIILLIYVGIERIGATLYTDVVLPDFTNWLYNNGHAMSYAPHTSLFILLVTRADNWFRFTLQIQFVLSNVFFVIVAGVVDFIMGVIISEVHLHYKWNTKNIKHTLGVLYGLTDRKFFATNPNIKKQI
jgi:hypothetical protein